MTMLFAKFKKYIIDEGLIEPGESVVVSVSGGIDSMVMLDMLARLAGSMKLSLSVAHVNHGLRGKASDADESLVRKEAERRDLPCDVKRLVPAKKDNIQDAARKLRQSFLKRIAQTRGASAICIGHHMGDQAETILLHLIRGSGLTGLKGMSPTSFIDGVRVVRPMLFAPRADIEKYAAVRHIAFREDASNTKACYRRNQIRHTILPFMNQINPRIEARLAMMSELLALDDDALDAVALASLDEALISEEKCNISLRRTAYIAMPAAIRRRMLRLAYSKLVGSNANLNSDQIMRMDRIALSKEAQREYRLKAPWQFTRDGELICIGARKASNASNARNVKAKKR